MMGSSNESEPVPRLVPDESFPPYAYIPGRFPHPTGDPAGHSFGTNPGLPPRVEPDQWQTCRPYQYGIDLFNNGYYWESHVAWESLWLACGREGTVADFLKGLIKLAAAGVKAREGRPEGVRTHSRRAAELFRSVARSTVPNNNLFMGLQVTDLIELSESIEQNGWPTRPPILIPTEPS
jgi:hypothetical protein